MWRSVVVSVPSFGHCILAVLGAPTGNDPCHSRAGGNPGDFGCFLDPCFRRRGRVGLLRRNPQSSGNSGDTLLISVLN